MGNAVSSINPIYLNPAMRQSVKDAFSSADPPVIALGAFLTPHALRAAQRARGWRRVTIPDQYAYSIAPDLPLQKHMRAWAQETLGTALLPDGRKWFRHRDYTLLHDDEPQVPGVLALLFLDTMREEWGGQVVLVRNGETLARSTPSENTLLLIRRQKGAHIFIQYVNHHAKNGVRILS